MPRASERRAVPPCRHLTAESIRREALTATATNVVKISRPLSGNAQLRDHVVRRMVALPSTSEFRSSLVLFMLRSRFASHAVALIGLILGPSLAAADSGTPAARGVGLAIEDFTYLDTSGEPSDQVTAHQKRLQALNTAFRQDFAADRQY